MVGQRLVQRLHNHTQFEIAFLGASERSAGKKYEDASVGRLESSNPLPQMYVHRCDPKLYPKDVPLLFSALDSVPAKHIEAEAKASGRYVVSNASAYRMDEKVPLIIPEVNPDHLSLLEGKPGIITNPNCCAIPLALSLAPLQSLGIKAVCVSTYQAVSGAGYPGESAWDMIGNVHPHAGNEEEKLAIEPQKILGSTTLPAQFPISARCVRVPTADGHLLGVQVLLDTPITPQEAKNLFSEYSPPFPSLPSSPTPLFVLHTRRDRPAPRFDTMAGDGMAISIGRIESCAVLTLKYFVLAHNTIRGAAGAAIANAELLLASNLLS
jgi:aspartate-semialdehyde dehydrogenase